MSESPPLQGSPMPSQTLPVVSFHFTRFDGSPEEARVIARELGKELSETAKAIVDRGYPGQNLRIVVYLK